jgi:hypothetical protein
LSSFLWSIKVQTGRNKINLLTQYESETEKVLFCNAVLAALMPGRKYDVISLNGDCSREEIYVLRFFERKSIIKLQRRYRTQYGKDPPTDNAIRHWLKQFQETGSVLHRRGTERPSIWQEEVDRIQGAWTSCV